MVFVLSFAVLGAAGSSHLFPQWWGANQRGNYDRCAVIQWLLPCIQYLPSIQAAPHIVFFSLFIFLAWRIHLCTTNNSVRIFRILEMFCQGSNPKLNKHITETLIQSSNAENKPVGRKQKRTRLALSVGLCRLCIVVGISQRSDFS